LLSPFTAFDSSLTSLILVIEPVGRELGADDREAAVVAFARAPLTELATLGREVGGAFFTASDTDARGRP